MSPYADRERQKQYMRDYARNKRQEFKELQERIEYWETRKKEKEARKK